MIYVEALNDVEVSEGFVTVFLEKKLHPYVIKCLERIFKN